MTNDIYLAQYWSINPDYDRVASVTGFSTLNILNEIDNWYIVKVILMVIGKLVSSHRHFIIFFESILQKSQKKVVSCWFFTPTAATPSCYTACTVQLYLQQ